MKKGLKTIELRLYDENRQKVRVGDQIEFTCLENRTQKTLTRLVALHRFGSFEEMFRELPAGAMGYSEGQIPKAEDMEEQSAVPNSPTFSTTKSRPYSD